ncbi:MAG: hypothetical protein ACJ8G7_25015 [Rhizobacter sp.]
MNDRAAPFNYRLNPLLHRDSWERDSLGRDLQRARRAFEQLDGLYKASLARIALAETQMRELHQDNKPIPLDVRRMLQLHLKHEYAASALRQQEASQAERALEQVFAQFESKRLAVSALEKHRDRQAQEHQVGQTRLMQRLSDELWLNRRRPRGEP